MKFIISSHVLVGYAMALAFWGHPVSALLAGLFACVLIGATPTES